MIQAKNYEIVSKGVKVMPRILYVGLSLPDTVYNLIFTQTGIPNAEACFCKLMRKFNVPDGENVT